MSTEQEEPEDLLCPITKVMIKDPVVTLAGHTYERSALLQFWQSRQRYIDPNTNTTLSSNTLITNWDKRRAVASWLDQNPDAIPHGWQSRELPPACATPTPTRPAAVPRDGGREHAWGNQWMADAGTLILWGGKWRETLVLACVALAWLCGLSIGAGVFTGGAAHIPPLAADPEPLSWDELERAPKGTTVEVKRSNAELDVVIPSAGLSIQGLGVTAFGTFWNGFVAVWTGGALFAGAPLPFVLFSLPFWAVGGGMSRMSVDMMFLAERLHLTEREFELNRQWKFCGWTVGVGSSASGALDDVDGVLAGASRGGQMDRMEMSGQPLVLSEGVTQHRFGAALGSVEQAYVANMVQAWLMQAKAARSGIGSAA